MKPANASSAKPSRTAWHKLNVKLSKSPWVQRDDNVFILARSKSVVSLHGGWRLLIENTDGLALSVNLYGERLSYRNVWLHDDLDDDVLPFHYVPKEFLTVLRPLFGDKWVEGLIKYKYTQALKPWRKLLKEHGYEVPAQ